MKKSSWINLMWFIFFVLIGYSLCTIVNYKDNKAIRNYVSELRTDCYDSKMVQPLYKNLTYNGLGDEWFVYENDTFVPITIVGVD